ncbi:MAG TPA: response regulator transcription factor [Symbiobacteriaceae bacterium]|nr:response regulator transcription factor [Symbiobacteriaceae bacterium]
MSGERVLIVDDDERMLQVIDEYLQSEGYITLKAADGAEAVRVWQEKRPDLLVLDWMMPRMSGLDVARQIRQHGSTPIIMLTARAEEADKLVGLELGADDYLTKPFSLRELTARIRAVLRRSKPDAAQTQADTVSFGEIVIDLAAHTVRVGGDEAGLTATEFKLLSVLGRSPNRVFSRLQLMEAAVGDYYEGYERTIDSHISHLRRKLGGYESLIQTVKGTGYKLVPPKG